MSSKSPTRRLLGVGGGVSEPSGPPSCPIRVKPMGLPMRAVSSSTWICDARQELIREASGRAAPQQADDRPRGGARARGGRSGGAGGTPSRQAHLPLPPLKSGNRSRTMRRRYPRCRVPLDALTTAPPRRRPARRCRPRNPPHPSWPGSFRRCSR